MDEGDDVALKLRCQRTYGVLRNGNSQRARKAAASSHEAPLRLACLVGWLLPRGHKKSKSGSYALVLAYNNNEV